MASYSLAEIPMSLLRIFASLYGQPNHCRWLLMEKNKLPVSGEGPLSELPRHTQHVQLVLPAAQVMLTTVTLPQGTKHPQGSALAYAMEDEMLEEPDTNQVSWLGLVDTEHHQVAVIDKAGLLRWQEALQATGIDDYEIHCETLFLPFINGEWSIDWNGSDGFVRNGLREGSALINHADVASAAAPLSLVMLMEEARTNQTIPTAIALYTPLHQAPDIQRWTKELGVPVYLAEHQDWRNAPVEAGVNLAPSPKHWRIFTGLLAALRPAAAILCVALVIHISALATEHILLVKEQRSLRERMETQFRRTFPEAVAVSDPALQMRRKLSEAYAASGQSDNSDFLPMMEQMAMVMSTLPADSVRSISYDSGGLSIELSTLDETTQQQLLSQLLAAGLESTVTRSGTSVLLNLWVS